jgi:hypothetical protein
MRQKYDRFQWPRRLRRKSAAARLLGLRSSRPARVMDICLLQILCCAGSVLCDDPFPRPGKTYRVCMCVCVTTIYEVRQYPLYLQRRGRRGTTKEMRPNISSWCSQSAIAKLARVNGLFKRARFLLIDR